MKKAKVLYLALLLAVLCKFIFFYSRMSVDANAWVVTAISTLFAACLFLPGFIACQRRQGAVAALAPAPSNAPSKAALRYIPAIIYALFSILMVADATYCSFFNRYLSVTALGSASMIGDVSDSIADVFSPLNLLLLTDAVAAFFIIHFAGRREDTLPGSCDVAENDTEVATETEAEDTLPESCEAAENDTEVATETVAADTLPGSGRCWLRVAECVALVMLLVFVINPGKSQLLTSIRSQEFLTYHIADVVDNVFAGGRGTDGGHGENGYYLATGTYEHQKGGELFGVAKGRNVIIIQMESFQNMLIDASYENQEITPFLNEFIRDDSTIYFDNFYSQIGGGNTSDAEFATNNSIFGSVESYTYQLFENNYFRGMPWLLREKGYSTSVMHGFKKDFWNRSNAYETLGIERFYCDEDFTSDNIAGIGAGRITGISDHAFFEQAASKMTELKKPYYNMLITLSTHNPYGLPEELKQIELKPEDENLVGHYLCAQNYADRCLGEFIEELKENGEYENSVILMYGDHFGLSKSDESVDEAVSKWLGHEYTYDNMANVPLIIHIPGVDVRAAGFDTVEISGGQIDIMPTLAYLLGFDTLDTIYFGQNLLTAESGFVPVQTHMLKGSFIKDDVVFQMSRDGVFSHSNAWNRKTRESVPIDGLEGDYLKAKQMIELSEFYLYNDVLRMAFVENMGIDEILNGTVGREREMPEEMQFFYIREGNLDDLWWLNNYLSQNPDAFALVSGDDVSSALALFEKEYSGKVDSDIGDIGEVQAVDEEKAAAFADMKSRIVVLKYDTYNYSKLEYSGYKNIMLMPDFTRADYDDILEFIKNNHPSAYLCKLGTDVESNLEEIRFALNAGIEKVYAYRYGTISDEEKQMLAEAGVYGIVLP